MKKIKVIVFLFFGWLAAWGQTNSYPEIGNVNIFQPSGVYRSYDVTNFNSNIVSRFEATTDGTGQLWLKDAAGNYKVAIRSNTTYPSIISGDLILGEYTMTSKNRKLYVDGTSEITGKLYGGADFAIYQSSSGYRAYDVVNRNGITVSRLEATTDASGQLWFKDEVGNNKVIIRSNNTGPSVIAGEFVVGEYSSTSKGKKFYVKGDSWMEGQLGIDGNVRAEEVKVEIINGPDYVFESDYELRTLKETQEYIKENKHLPEIPSAPEMEANGIDLGDMNMRLLKKIEELTLYLIEQNRQNQTQQVEIEALKAKIIHLENK